MNVEDLVELQARLIAPRPHDGRRMSSGGPQIEVHGFALGQRIAALDQGAGHGDIAQSDRLGLIVVRIGVIDDAIPDERVAVRLPAFRRVRVHINIIVRATLRIFQGDYSDTREALLDHRAKYVVARFLVAIDESFVGELQPDRAILYPADG